MTLALTLPEPTVEVVAGQCATVDVLVHNDGGQDHRVRLEIAGRAAPWVRVAAADDADQSAGSWQVVGAGQRLTVPLRVSPPRGAAVPGQLVPFSVRATSPGSQRPAAVATGLVLMTAPVPVTAALVPATSRAAGRSEHLVQLTTDDTAGVLVTLRGTTTSSGATVTVEPVAVRVEPGTPARAQVAVRPRRPVLWRTRSHPFEVVWETDAADGLARGMVTGRLDQPPVLPAPVTALLSLGLVAALVLGVVALWPSGDRSSPGATGRGDPSASSPAGTEPTAGPLAVLHALLKEPDPAAARRLAEDRAAEEQVPPPTAVTVVDGSAVAGWDADFWLVVVSGFSDVEAARTFCDSRTRSDGVSRCRVVD